MAVVMPLFVLVAVGIIQATPARGYFDVEPSTRRYTGRHDVLYLSHIPNSVVYISPHRVRS